MQHIVIAGATSLIAEHCARIWVAHPVKLTLAGRNPEHLARIADDLRIRSPQSIINVEITDFLNNENIQQFAKASSSNGVDIVLIAHGVLPDQKSCEGDLKLSAEMIQLNAISPVIFAEAFASHMQRQDSGTIAVIGSVAGDRGRRSNYVYGASKGFIDRYLEGMRHRFAGTGLKIITIKPGPTQTPMTANLSTPPQGMAKPEGVATDIVRGIATGKSIIYTPAKWRLIMLIIRQLPTAIFNRLDI